MVIVEIAGCSLIGAVLESVVEFRDEEDCWVEYGKDVELDDVASFEWLWAPLFELVLEENPRLVPVLIKVVMLFVLESDLDFESVACCPLIDEFEAVFTELRESVPLRIEDCEEGLKLL